MKKNINTILIHGKDSKENNYGATTLPVFQSTAFGYESCEKISKVFNGDKSGYIYTRISNPTLNILEKRLYELEDGVGAIVTASGMAAISSAILTLAKTGHHIVASNSLFGGTYAFFNKTIREFGINTAFVDPSVNDNFKDAIRPETKAIFIETIGNPKMDVPDIAGISKIAQKNGIPLIVDSTLTTPFLINPKEFGADIIIHSTSKFINGHGNSIGGVIIDTGKFNWNSKRFEHFGEYHKKYGIFAFLAKTRKEVFRDLGPCFSPGNAFLMSIGLETLGLRMEKCCGNAEKLAEYLKNHDKVETVNFPGLKGNKFNKIAEKQFKGFFGSLMTFTLKDKESCFKMIDALLLALNLANLGDTKTLVIHPASTICIEFNKEEKKNMGVTDNLVRISVGIEHIDDIVDDFKQALDKI